MKTAKELIKIIIKNNLQKGLFNVDYIVEYLENLDGEYFDTSDECLDYLKSLGLDNFEQLMCVSNTDEMYSIIHFKNDDIYLKLIGEYDSYGEFDHDYERDIIQVFPKQVTITQYLPN